MKPLQGTARSPDEAKNVHRPSFSSMSFIYEITKDFLPFFHSDRVESSISVVSGASMVCVGMKAEQHREWS
jgi:hypothetical protein